MTQKFGSTMRAALAAVAGTLALALAVAGCGGASHHYGYSDEEIRRDHIELLVRPTRRQPRLLYADRVFSYLATNGIDCPNFQTDASFGSTDPWGGKCYGDPAATATLGGWLYSLETFKTSDDKLDYLNDTHTCEGPLAHEYWVEGPNWYIEVHDLSQPDPNVGEVSTHDLAVTLANALGARLYRAC